MRDLMAAGIIRRIKDGVKLLAKVRHVTNRHSLGQYFILIFSFFSSQLFLIIKSLYLKN